jgi:DNA-packaging protein gp3
MADETPDIGGRPAKFDSPAKLEAAVDEYIANTPVNQVTITGLCMWLGFSSRSSLHDYKKRDGFSAPIEKALLAVENSYEITLRTPGVVGSIFALKNMGWKDKTEQEISGKDGGPVQIQGFNYLPPESGTEIVT